MVAFILLTSEMFTPSCPQQWTEFYWELWTSFRDEMWCDWHITRYRLFSQWNVIQKPDHTHTSTVYSGPYTPTYTPTHKPSNQTGVKWWGPYSCCCAVRWYANWQASPLEATITLAFLPVRHTSRGQRTCVIDWVCLIVVPSLFTRVLIYDRRREGGRSFGRWRAGNRAINHQALRAPHFLITSQPIELTVSPPGNRACIGRTF